VWFPECIVLPLLRLTPLSPPFRKTASIDRMNNNITWIRSLATSILLTPGPKPPSPSLTIDESVKYFHPETHQLVEFTVRGLRRVGESGMSYLVSYVDNGDDEVTLNEEEMNEVLRRRVKW